MQDHWDAYGPPAYMSVASYLGLVNKTTTGGDDKPPVEDKRSEDEKKYGNLNELANMFSGSGGLI